MRPSSKLDLIEKTADCLDEDARPTAALAIRRLKKTPQAPDNVVWFAAANELKRKGYEVNGMLDQMQVPDPSLCSSLLRESNCEYSQVVVI